ncbi:MAG: Ribosomal large subunit pseudouridine synthase B [Anaerolineae bacterium]|nr:Ribosomal large subunit pseudouridine synthase B [Anaerolineae bacterium]
MTKKATVKTAEERLQKVLAHAGVASRRACEELILAGRVAVNRRVVTELGVKVNPRRDVITVDGEPIAKKEEHRVYIILNKPRDVLSAASDERGRQTVVDLVDVPERVYPVGRLDFNSEGLVLLTNDGELTQKLMHPSHHVEKEYHVLVTGKPSTDKLFRWREGGIEVEGQPSAPAIVEKLNEEGEDTWLRIVLTEGRKRQIRVIAKTLKHPVKVLIRVRLGPIKLGRLKPGRWRHLTFVEVARLRRAVK